MSSPVMIKALEIKYTLIGMQSYQPGIYYFCAKLQDKLCLYHYDYDRENQIQCPSFINVCCILFKETTISLLTTIGNLFLCDHKNHEQLYFCSQKKATFHCCFKSEIEFSPFLVRQLLPRVTKNLSSGDEIHIFSKEPSLHWHQQQFIHNEFLFFSRVFSPICHIPICI